MQGLRSRVGKKKVIPAGLWGRAFGYDIFGGLQFRNSCSSITAQQREITTEVNVIVEFRI